MIGQFDVFYDAVNGGFELEDGEGRVRVPAKRHKQLLLGRSKGKRIVPDANGNPVLKAQPDSISKVRDGRLSYIEGQYAKALGGLDENVLSKSGILPAMAMECSIWIVSNDAGDCPMLSAYAKEMDTPMDGAFVQSIMERYYSFATQAGRLAAKHDQLIKEVRSATKKADIDSVTW